jgi:hypothetical protein
MGGDERRAGGGGPGAPAVRKEKELDNELKTYLEDLKAELKAHVTESCYNTETKLLRAFHGWAQTGEAHGKPQTVEPI